MENDNMKTAEELKASACLIAAAPELLMVLKQHFEELDALPNPPVWAKRHWRELRIAISKAEGRA